MPPRVNWKDLREAAPSDAGGAADKHLRRSIADAGAAPGVSGGGGADPAYSRNRADGRKRWFSPWTSAFSSTIAENYFPSASAVRTAPWMLNCYDLLASEARLTSFIAIAKGDVPVLPLVSSGPRADAGRPRLGADFVVRLDVRISDAGPGHALPGGKLAEPDVSNRWCAGKSSTARNAECPGEFRNPRINARDIGFHLPIFQLWRARPGT